MTAPQPPAAPDVRDSLRGEIARAIYVEGAWCGECDYDGFDLCSGCRATVRGYADAVLACPTIAAALGAVERVRALGEEWARPRDYTSHYRDGLRDAAREIRRALDGEPFHVPGYSAATDPDGG